MNKYKKIIIRLCSIVIIALLAIFGGVKAYQKIQDDRNGIGRVIDSYKGVDVHYNGDAYGKNHGKNYSSDGYYYGYKWQCVEYIKRFYYEAKGHKMPDGFGNAKDFFDEDLDQGEFNEKRGLYQYKNGGNTPPEADDILVFNDTTYGHIVTISDVGDDYVEVVQQNMEEDSRDKFDLKCILMEDITSVDIESQLDGLEKNNKSIFNNITYTDENI